MGDAEAAQVEYRKGGVHQTTFYGLLAAEKAGMGIDPALVADGPEPDWRQAEFATSSVWRAAGLWNDAGEQWEAIRFLSHLAEIVPAADLVALTDATMSLGNTFVTVRVAKQAASEGVVAPRLEQLDQLALAAGDGAGHSRDSGGCAGAARAAIAGGQRFSATRIDGGPETGRDWPTG